MLEVHMNKAYGHIVHLGNPSSVLAADRSRGFFFTACPKNIRPSIFLSWNLFLFSSLSGGQFFSNLAVFYKQPETDFVFINAYLDGL